MNYLKNKPQQPLPYLPAAPPHRQILREVWGREYENETHYLRVYFAQLRQKIEANPTVPTIIVTEAGIGYRLKSG